MVTKPVCYYKTFLTDLHLQLRATPGNSASTEDMKQDLVFAKNQLGKVWGAKSYLLLPQLFGIKNNIWEQQHNFKKHIALLFLFSFI